MTPTLRPLGRCLESAVTPSPVPSTPARLSTPSQEDMYAKAVQGTTPAHCVKWAEVELNKVYEG